MGVQYEVLTMACAKGHAQRWAQVHYREEVPHCFTDFYSVLGTHGKCCFHPGTSCQKDSRTPDLTTFSLSLAIWNTTSRNTSQGVKKCNRKLDQYDQLIDDFVEYLHCRKPLSWIVEASDEFTLQQCTGSSQCSSFMEKVVGVGGCYAVRAIKMDHKFWIEVPRVKTFILGFSSGVGASTAADWVIRQIRDGLQMVGMVQPVSISQIMRLMATRGIGESESNSEDFLTAST